MLNYEITRIVVELQSIAWTFPVVVLCFFVAKEASKIVKKLLLGSTKEKKSFNAQMKWLICGIFIGFTGNLIDNFYWSLPWSLNYLNDPHTKLLQDFGCFPNLLFRQFMTLAAAYCHIRAFISPTKSDCTKNLHRIIIISLLGGQCFILALYLINLFAK
jgi:hypothetical protein